MQLVGTESSPGTSMSVAPPHTGWCPVAAETSSVEQYQGVFQGAAEQGRQGEDCAHLTTHV